MGVDVKRLQVAIEWSQRQLEAPRRSRTETVRQFVGSRYAANGAEKVVPVNLLELAVTTYLRHLAAQAPRVMVSSRVDELKPFAKNMELALNQIPEEIGLATTFRRVVLEALFGVGVVKVGIATGGESILGHDVGRSFVDLVTLDDYFLDMSAKSREEIQFEGNDYWVDLETARAMDDGEGKLDPDEHTVHGENGAQRAEGIGRDTGADLFKEKVWLRDVWIPSEQCLVTYGVKSRKVLREVPWDGPENGPYHTLSFTDVPGNLLPLAPASLWFDLHHLANELFRKLSRQAVAKKSVVTFAGGNNEDVEALKKAADGDGIRYSGQKPEALVVGGIDAETLAFFLQCRDLSNYMGGNLDALGGLAPMSETASQDKLMADAAGARLASMKGRTTEFAAGVWKALAWYEWTDPVRVRTIEKPSSAPGSDIVLRRKWSEETREGDFLDFNLKVDPYSMEDDTPAGRLQKIGATLERFVFPVLPMIQQAGGQLDWRKLMELVARLANVDEVRELVRFGEPIEGDPAAGGSDAASFKPTQTTRNYVRTNRPGATRAGKDDVMARILMGGGVQQAEAASLGRGVS